MNNQINDGNMINFYNDYRMQLFPYLLNSDLNNYYTFIFTFDDVNGNTCKSVLEKNVNNERQIILQKDFSSSELFRVGLFEPFLTDYAKTNKIINSKISDFENGLSQYILISKNSNVLILNNLNKKYIEYIDSVIKDIKQIN